MNETPIRALIIDDEPLARANLRHALAAFPRWRIESECGTTLSARGILERSAVDAIFLDIRMPRESGIEFARILADQAEPSIVVFVTAYDSFAIEAFELHALDYLLKPFDDERLAKTLRRAEALFDQRSKAAYASALRDYVHRSAGLPPADRPALSRLTVRSVGRIESIEVKDILWISSASNYVELHLGDRTVLHRVTLAALEQRLDPAAFVRTHRSAMVRLDQCSRPDRRRRWSVPAEVEVRRAGPGERTLCGRRAEGAGRQLRHRLTAKIGEPDQGLTRSATPESDPHPRRGAPGSRWRTRRR